MALTIWHSSMEGDESARALKMFSVKGQGQVLPFLLFRKGLTDGFQPAMVPLCEPKEEAN